VEALGALCHLLYVIVSAIVGARLLVRGWRAQAMPERWLGFALLGIGGVGYLAMLIPAAIGPEVETPLTISLSIAGQLLVDAGMLSLLGFTLSVFRPESRVARGVAAVLAAITIAAVAGMFAAGDWWGKEVRSVAYWAEILGAQGALAWATGEAWLYLRQLGRRAVLGLAEPEIANRALLWTGFGVAQLGLMVAVTLATCLYAATGRIFVTLDIVMAGCGLASSLCLWLAFWPPAFYRSWAVPLRR
jgi:hypothetical protein